MWHNKLIFHSLAQASQIGTGSCSGWSTFILAIWLLPRKAAEDALKPWNPGPTWEVWKKLLAWTIFGHASHFGSKPVDRRLSLSHSFFKFALQTKAWLKLNKKISKLNTVVIKTLCVCIWNLCPAFLSLLSVYVISSINLLISSLFVKFIKLTHDQFLFILCWKCCFNYLFGIVGKSKRVDKSKLAKINWAF